MARRRMSYRPKIFTNGCFDLFHAGHLKVLKECSKLGEVHVGINSDYSIITIKGPGRPIIPEEQRVEIVSSLIYVDYVYLFDEPTPIKLIETIQPDIIVKGGDYKISEVVGNDYSKIVIVERIKDISTTMIIDNILKENSSAHDI